LSQPARPPTHAVTGQSWQRHPVRARRGPCGRSDSAQLAMGKKPKGPSQAARKAARREGARRGGEEDELPSSRYHRSGSNLYGEDIPGGGFSIFNDDTKSVETFPFGLDGPSVRMQQRYVNPLFRCVHGFWLVVVFGNLATFGLGGLALFTTFCWVVHACFCLALFVMHCFPDGAREAVFTFWALPVAHGLAWALPLQVLVGGQTPGSLWARWGEALGEDLLLCQLGSPFLLLAPGLVTTLYTWWESPFVALAFYDLRSQLLAEHKRVNYIFCLLSPVLALAAWHAACNPRAITDLATPRPVLFAACSAAANAALLHTFAFRAHENFIGTVRWLGPKWLVWLVPLGFRMRGMGMGGGSRTRL